MAGLPVKVQGFYGYCILKLTTTSINFFSSGPVNNTIQSVFTSKLKKVCIILISTNFFSASKFKALMANLLQSAVCSRLQSAASSRYKNYSRDLHNCLKYHNCWSSCCLTPCFNFVGPIANLKTMALTTTLVDVINPAMVAEWLA